MRPTQRALLQTTLDLALATCLRSPVATADGAHLRAVLLGELLGAGCALLEPAAESRRAKLLRLADDVVRVERVPLPPGPPGRRRPRPPDLRLWHPERLDVEVHARGAFALPPAGAGRLLHERLARLAARATDVVLLACDRRSYDVLRRPPAGRGEGEGGHTPLSALCAAVLPPSCTLAADFEEAECDVGRGQRWLSIGAVTPMVFGVQRVVVALTLRAGTPRPLDAEPAAAQLDAFAAD